MRRMNRAPAPRRATGADGINRRYVLTSIAAAASLLGPARALAEAAQAANAAPTALRFFSKAEFELLDVIAEMLIPADAQSGGARAAGVARVLDERIAESRDPAWRQSWHDDLAEIDRLSRKMFGQVFVGTSEAQRHELMRLISKNEAKPSQPGEYAFGTFKWSIADVYYRTRIGIHDELQYQGNVMQDEFSGTDVSKSR